MIQLDIYDTLLPKFTFDRNKPIKLFEAFSGVGMQRIALNRMGVLYESVGYSEIDKYAIKSYQAIHDDYQNFGDICKIKGTDLPKIDLFTYSFPCTDLSKAGQQKGLNNTRSGLVYEVLRILNELKDLDNLPKVLLMENVVDLVQVKFIKQFNEIQVELEKLGYSNYTQCLNAKNYGVAQNRDRVFMVSILGNYNYKFPQTIPLEKKLKDYLQPIEEIEEKYYLSDKMLNTFPDNQNRNGYKRSDKFNPITRDDTNSFCITTREGCTPTGNYIKEPLCLNSKVNNKQPSLQDRIYDTNGISTYITPSFHPNILVESDDVIIPEATKPDYYIRKLTPLECWRLMGIDDKDFYKAQQVNSNTQLYKQAGNGIVVDVLVNIFKQLYNERND